MSLQLANHNDDIRRLYEKGYALVIDEGYLIVRDIPYLDAELKLKIGAIIAKVVFIDQNRVTQDDHQIWFAGSFPHNLDGKPVPNLGGGPAELPLGEKNKDIVVERRFSNKPKESNGFPDFFEKIENYVTIISGPAMTKYDVTPYTFRSVQEIDSNSVFKFHDTLTSRAEITDLSAKLKDDVVAVIGLGGTGAYVLDFLAKTPVREIRIFDLDRFHVHNGFRAPGKLDPTEFDQLKADIFRSRYENFRSGITANPIYIDSTSADKLTGVTFAFVCVDNGSSRAAIFELLISLGIPFIDVGMGLNRKNGLLNGMVRTTYFSAEDGRKTLDKGLADLSEEQDDQYRTNIQIGEINALNACLAVIRFKQLRGFYAVDDSYYNLLFEICDLKIVTAYNIDAN